MPNAVKTESDEKKWRKAKEIAEKEGHKEDYAYIMGIYKNMKGEKNTKDEKKEAELKALFDEIIMSKEAGRFPWTHLNRRDMERHMDLYLNPTQQDAIEDLIGQAEERSIGLKNPEITALLTLGIWPALARKAAKDRIMRSLLVRDEDARRAIEVAARREAASKGNLVSFDKESSVDREKVAGVLDNIARKGPKTLRPLLQKLIVMFKYPELHAMSRQAHHFRKLRGSGQKGVIANLLKNNKELYKRMLSTEGKIFSGKSMDDFILRESQTPNYDEILRMMM